MRKTKIVHILHSAGGVDVSLRLILENINTSDFENIVIHGFKDTNAIFTDKNSNTIVEYKLPISRDISPLNDIVAIVKSYFIIRKEKPDLIHAHSAKGGVIGRLIGMLTGIKVLFTPQAYSFLSTSNNVKRGLFLTIEKLLSKGNTLLVASSPSEMERGIKEVGYNSNKVKLFNNAIEPITEIRPLSIEKTWPDNYICTVGRPCYQKNIIEMINVFYEVRKTLDIHLVLMGVGHHSDQLEIVKQQILDLGLDRHVTLLNWTSRQDVLNIISKSKIYISTARYEGLPYSIIESLALGVPCVVSNCDGNRDLIKDNHNGFVIIDNNTVDFCTKIIKLVNDKALHKEFSKNAIEMFKENYNMDERIKELEIIYLNNKKTS